MSTRCSLFFWDKKSRNLTSNYHVYRDQMIDIYYFEYCCIYKYGTKECKTLKKKIVEIPFQKVVKLIEKYQSYRRLNHRVNP